MNSASMLDMHTEVMVGVWLRLNAIWLKNKLLQVGGAAAYTVGTAAYTAGAAIYTAGAAAYVFIVTIKLVLGLSSSQACFVSMTTIC